MSTLKVNEVRHLSNTGTANVTLDSNATTNLQATTTLGLTVTGTLTVSGLSTFNGNMVVGNATTDTVDLQSKVTGFNNFSGFTGEIRMYAGNEGPNAPPAGWLYCNGDTISSTINDGGTNQGGTHYNADGKGNDYEPLFNLLKTNNNWGNSGSPAWGTDTVKLPDFRSRSPVGVHTGAANAADARVSGGVTANTGTALAAGLTARLIGATSGTETHALTIAELAAHTHNVVITGASATGQTLTATTAEQSGHTHTIASHTHTSAAHIHTMPSHTHTSAAHTHATGGHTHNIEHRHTSAAHTHAFTTGQGSEHNHGNGVWNQLMRISAAETGQNNTPAHFDTGGTGTEINLSNSGTIQPESTHTHTGTTDATTPVQTGYFDGNAAAVSDLNITSTTPDPTGSTDPGDTNSTTPAATGSNTSGLITSSTDPAITVTSGTLGGETHTHAITPVSTGSGTAHTNLSPIIAVNYIIKV